MMPKSEDIERCRIVAYPPTNKMIVDYIAEVVETLPDREDYDAATMEPIRRLVALIKKKSADKTWLLRILHVLDSKHPVFEKGYRYVRPRNKLNPARLEVFQNHDGFYDGLPPL